MTMISKSINRNDDIFQFVELIGIDKTFEIFGVDPENIDDMVERFNNGPNSEKIRKEYLKGLRLLRRILIHHIQEAEKRVFFTTLELKTIAGADSLLKTVRVIYKDLKGEQLY